MSENALPCPGANERFTVRTLSAEDVPVWYHAYRAAPAFAGNGPSTFNEGWGESRFAPLELAGEMAHTYYMASCRECVYLESVFHDIELGRPAFFDLSQLTGYRLAMVRLRQAIRYVSFHSHDLHTLGVRRALLIDSLPPDYPMTRKWSEAGLSQRPDAAAIGYTSRRNDAGRCLMLVRQRLPEPPFEVVDDLSLGGTPRLRSEVIELASSLGVAVY